MSTQKAFCKFMAIIFLSAVFCGSLLGCDRPTPQGTVDKLLAYLQSGEYPRIYQLLTDKARKSISLVDLSKRYDDIYTTIGLKKATCKLTRIRDVNQDNKIADFTMSVTADKLGEFTMNMEAPLRYENGNWLVDWTSELILPDLEQGDKAKLTVTPAKRGEIFDSTGEVLAKNDYALSIYVDPSQVKNYETLIRLLAPQVGMTEDAIRKLLATAMLKAAGATAEAGDTVPPEAEGITQTGSPDATPEPSPTLSPTPTPTVSGSPQPTATAAEQSSPLKVIKTYPRDGLTDEQKAKLLEIPGVGIDDSWMTMIRTYPYGDLLAHTLGYTGVMAQTDLSKPENAGLPQDAIIGKKGLEQAYEQQLRGQPGYALSIVDSNGTAKTTLASRAETDGKDLRLTVDIKLQQKAEMLLRQYLTTDMKGSVIVLDPKTGCIQALAIAPAFDPNLFSFPIDPAVFKAMPQFNLATQGLYPPGSTFKPFTASMALTDGKITNNTVFPYSIKNNTWLPTDTNWMGPAIKRSESYSGSVNLQNAITYSDNIFFAWAAMQIGGSSFYQHCLDLGLTAKMSFDLPLSTSSITNSGTFENMRLLADSGYGQGEFKITPLQMAALFSSLANGGDIMQPRLVQSVCRTVGSSYITEDTQQTVWKKAVVPKNNLQILLPYLKRVASIGTAKALNVSALKPYEICAKTGTAEIGTDKSREIAWLIGFATEKMDRLVCVTIEVPAGKGDIRTSIARGMFEANASSTPADDAAANEAAQAADEKKNN